MPRTLAILLALLAAAVLPACGSEEEQPSADAGKLLSQAFGTGIESGKVNLAAEVQVDGLPGLGDGIEVRMAGPFTRTEMDLDVTLGGFGPGFSGGLTVTEENAYIEVAGRAYEVGEDVFRDLIRDTERETGKDYESLTLKDLGLKFEDWLRDPRVDGDEEVSGEPVTKVSAGLDAAAILRDLGTLAGTTGETSDLPVEDLEAFADFVEDSRIDVYVSKDDSTVRRMALELEFEVPEEMRGDVGGAQGGAVSVDVTFTDVGKPQRIEPPEDARPLEDLLRQFGLGAELFLQ